MPTPANAADDSFCAPTLLRVTRVLGVACLMFLVACGPASYSVQSAKATSAVERARQAEVANEAPYEFYKAEAHLDKAREEAASAEYEDAIALAKQATELANSAIEIARRRRRASLEANAGAER